MQARLIIARRGSGDGTLGPKSTLYATRLGLVARWCNDLPFASRAYSSHDRLASATARIAFTAANPAATSAISFKSCLGGMRESGKGPLLNRIVDKARHQGATTLIIADSTEIILSLLEDARIEHTVEPEGLRGVVIDYALDQAVAVQRIDLFFTEVDAMVASGRKNKGAPRGESS